MVLDMLHMLHFSGLHLLLAIIFCVPWRWNTIQIDDYKNKWKKWHQNICQKQTTMFFICFKKYAIKTFKHEMLVKTHKIMLQSGKTIFKAHHYFPNPISSRVFLGGLNFFFLVGRFCPLFEILKNEAIKLRLERVIVLY